MLEFCKEKGLLVQAYMPLGSGSRNLLSDPDITKIAKQMGKTNGQVSIFKYIPILCKFQRQELLKSIHLRREIV